MKAWIKLAIGILLIGVLLYFVDWHESIEVPLDVSLVSLLLAILVLSLAIPVSALKWKLLFRHPL